MTRRSVYTDPMEQGHIALYLAIISEVWLTVEDAMAIVEHKREMPRPARLTRQLVAEITEYCRQHPECRECWKLSRRFAVNERTIEQIRKGP